MKRNRLRILRRPLSRGRRRQRRRGQALVEMALLGVLLGMLLAGAVDLGRAYYTAVIVTNMAGEGAAYASLFPDKDQNFPNPPSGSACSQFTVPVNDYIQSRVKRVAIDRGLVVDTSRVTSIVVSPTTCSNRCAGNNITVRVTYVINDLFLPGLLGMRNIRITKSSSQRIAVNAYNAGCS